MTRRHERGSVMLAVLIWLSLLGVMALGAALATSGEAPATGAVLDRLRLVRAAESAVSLAVAGLARVPDWTAVPTTGVASGAIDGPPGPRPVGGATIDLAGETWKRTCGRPTPCDDLATSSTDPARPWGTRNPRWRLVVHVPLADVDAAAGAACPCYIAAWVADDPADDDGVPGVDAAPGTAGHGVLLVRGAAWAGRDLSADVEALVAKPCRRSALLCPGSVVQSWGVVAPAPP